MAAVSKSAPVVQCGGLAKEFLVPGWRVGWLCVHDRNDVLADVRKGLAADCSWAEQQRSHCVCVCVTWFGAVWCLGTGPLAMPGYFRLSQLTLGANSLVQSIIPTVRRKSLRDAHVIRVFLTVRGGRTETAVQ